MERNTNNLNIKDMKKEFFRAFMEASVDSAFEEFKEQALNLEDGEMSCEGMEILKLSFKAGFVSACKLLTKPQAPTCSEKPNNSKKGGEE